MSSPTEQSTQKLFNRAFDLYCKEEGYEPSEAQDHVDEFTWTVLGKYLQSKGVDPFD